MFHLHLVRQARIESLQHLEHLVCVVQEAARKGVMHGCGSRILTEWLVETPCKFLDDAHQGLVRAIAEELLYRVVPYITTNRARQKIVELVVEQRLSAALQVAEIARLLAVVVLQIIEDDELSHLRLCRRLHVPNRHIDGLDEVCHLQRSIRRTGLRDAVAAADDEVFCVVHILFYI